MALHPTEVLELLREIHLPNLTEDENRILAATVTGWRSLEIAERLFRSDRDVRRVVQRLTDRVCEPTGTSHSLAVLGLWFAQHQECRFRCTAAAHAMLAAGAVFPSEAPSGET